MKKVTIITPPEYEGLVLESLGRAQVTQLKHVTGSEFEGLEAPSKLAVDYKELHQRVQTRLIEPLGLKLNELERVTPDVEELREFSRDPVGKVNALIYEAESLIGNINSIQESLNAKKNAVISELQRKLDDERDDLDNSKSKLVAQLEVIETEKAEKNVELMKLKAKVATLSAIASMDLKESFAQGIVKNEYLPQLNEYLKRYPTTRSESFAFTDEESLFFVFGNEENKKWVDSLFLVYDVKSLSAKLDSEYISLILEEGNRKNALEEYRSKLSKLEKEKPSAETSVEKDLRAKLETLDSEYEKRVADLKEEADKKVKNIESSSEKELVDVRENQKVSVGAIAYYSYVLKLYSKKNAPVLRGKVFSVLQGYTPENLVSKLEGAIAEVEEITGEKMFIEIDDLGPDDHHAPVPEKDFGSDKLQPLWILTRLRGWPSAIELNPGFISVLVFCFQFGLMFGDIGQGLVFLAIGLALNGKYKEGMMKYLFALFIPMGIAAILFGFAYDSIFLYEHEISHWLHEAHIELPFHYPIMPNPMNETGDLMNLIFQIGAIELVFGSLLGMLNAYKAKNYAGMMGEHGLGMGLYVTGLYLSAATMFTEGLDIMAVVAGFPFKLMLLGMGLSFIEPIVHSLMHGHGIGGMESIGQGIGGLLLTFVEGLANMFSFLRVAAFAIAHVSLSGAGEAMGHAIDNPLAGMVIMNVIALTFEFVSSSVQSIRLLYYEFMGKFFHGEGIRFKPYKINVPQPISE